MTTYATMRTRILDELSDELLTAAQVNNAIQSAIAHYQRERFYFNESRSETFLTIASQEFYATAANANIPNLSRIDKLTITVNSDRYPLEKKEWAWIDRMSVTTTSTGQPTDYCYYAQQIRLYPIPDAVYTVRISGLVRFAALSADSDSNAWMTDAEEMIRAHAKWDLALNMIMDQDIAGMASQVEARAKAGLDRETVRRGVSRISGYW